MLRRFPLVLFGATLVLLAVPAAPAVGAYVGSGPSEDSYALSECRELTTVAVYPSAVAPGRFAAEIACVYAYPFNTYSLGSGYRGMPSHVMNALEGSPETGLTGSGTANEHGTSPGTIEWTFTMGPVGEGTVWRIDFVSHPNSGGSYSSWWAGVADFTGA